MKLRNRLILDAVMFAFLWLVMSYNTTGNLLHEIIGIALMAGMITHIAFNWKYYRAMAKAIRRGRELPVKSMLIFVINIIMVVALGCMLISSIAISRDVFSILHLELKYYNVWQILHIISAITMLGCVCVHTFLHYNLFKTLVKKNAQNENYQKTANVISSALAILMICGVLKSSYYNIHLIVNNVGQTVDQVNQSYINSASNQTEDDTQYADESEDKDDSQYIDESQSADETQSLEEYLGGMHCSACGKHCSLLSPRCGRGENQAESATQDYYSTYNET